MLNISKVMPTRENPDSIPVSQVSSWQHCSHNGGSFSMLQLQQAVSQSLLHPTEKKKGKKKRKRVVINLSFEFASHNVSTLRIPFNFFHPCQDNQVDESKALLQKDERFQLHHL